jgi:hypothetical protein
VGGSFQQYFYNGYKIVVYTGLRSDSIKNHASRNEARIAATRIILTRIGCTLFTCDMYICRLRHINDPVLSSLKMEDIRLLFLVYIFIYIYRNGVCFVNYAVGNYASQRCWMKEEKKQACQIFPVSFLRLPRHLQYSPSAFMSSSRTTRSAGQHPRASFTVCCL